MVPGDSGHCGRKEENARHSQGLFEEQKKQHKSAIQGNLRRAVPDAFLPPGQETRVIAAERWRILNILKGSSQQERKQYILMPTDYVSGRSPSPAKGTPAITAERKRMFDILKGSDQHSRQEVEA